MLPIGFRSFFAVCILAMAAFRRPKMLDFTKYTHKLIGSFAWIISQNYDLKSMSESGTGTEEQIVPQIFELVFGEV